MATDSNQTTNDAAHAAQGATEQMGAQMRAGVEQLRASSERMTAAGTDLGMRLLDQAEENTRQAFAAMRAAAQAKDVSEVLRIQADYLREQSGRAVDQARQIGEMITNYGRDAMEQLGKR
ncbi:MAG: hypothetical protein A4S12_00760 [Proteobacteria bacterium SG_bin5]|nr:phasin family protein [Sphingomonas sp.]OQW42415.1 MAG: hypothetical protein A4S12_00760 [Proteobacteria bacterium SG_bin5]